MQARVASKHAKAMHRKYDCGVVQDKVWRHTTTQKGLLYMKQYSTRADTAGLRRTFAYVYRVCSCADGQAASTRARLHRARAEAREARACIQDASCADATKRQGASPRSWRPRLQEQTQWSARGEAGAAARRGRRRTHGMASRLGRDRGRTPGWDLGPGEGRGRFASSLPPRCRLFCKHGSSTTPAYLGEVWAYFSEV